MGLSHYVTVIFEEGVIGDFVLDETHIPAWSYKTSAELNGVKYTVATFQLLDPG